MAFRNSYTDDRRIPNWLKDNCLRLRDEGLNLRNLNMNIRRLNLASILALSEALKDNTRIETVNLTTSLSHTRDDHDASQILIPLANALCHHVSIKTIYLSYNQLIDATPLGASLELNRSSLTELYLDHNRLNIDTGVAIARALRHNNRLHVLQLNSNNLGDEGGEIIAEALRNNTGLKFLGLARNTLKSKTANALLQTLDFNRNVTLMHLCLSDNPDIPVGSEHTILYLVRSNRAGRYLLRDDDTKSSDNSSGDSNHSHGSSNNYLCRTMGGTKENPVHFSNCSTGHVTGTLSYDKRKLWPVVFEGLEPDMIYFFLRQKPSLVHSQTSDNITIDTKN
uniref:Uncharacterized protein n=1 Tax=Pseudo-nitzschia australis TaxID=44445 RepID=A0A7S4AX98_9STRA|mmetsp:Transcript_25612/g.56147  ORF Transcript_25612/g.56147 Transcript_25612/m.56147 type:complete len:338 (-) Transcript_25612:14-1027(-)